jgi:phosphoribosyl 1,2-cyclic phosphodiesterase
VDDTLIILDGGTGLRLLGNALLKENRPIKANLFFSHVHWDHIQGFPFFIPAFNAQNVFHIYGGKNLEMTLGDTLVGQMNYPNFPINLSEMASKIEFKEFEDGHAVKVGEKVTVKGLPLVHPNGCYGYRIESTGRAVAYCTDTEHGETPDKNVLELADNADLFIYDTQYFPDEYTGKTGGVPKKGWGHSTYEVAADLAKRANVKKLVLFHHDPGHDDKTVLKKEKLCKELFPNSQAAREGLVIDL